MHDTDAKNLFPVHIILGERDFAKIKIGTSPKVWHIGGPFTEQTKMGWVIMSAGR